MSDDLISRKFLLECAEYDNNGRLIIPYRCVKNAPTAFDKEKVILELSKKRYEALKMRDDENTSCTTELKSFWHSRLEAYTLAIEVIEKGGLNEYNQRSRRTVW